MRYEIECHRGIGWRKGRPVSVLSYYVNGACAGQSMDGVRRLLPPSIPRAIVVEACRHARSGWRHAITVADAPAPQRNCAPAGARDSERERT